MEPKAKDRFVDYLNIDDHTVDRVIFSGEELYKTEQKKIFARGWNFMCHESQIPKPGDFFLNYIGEESVIATRDRTGKLQVFLNSCRHRGNAVCRAEMGNARAFLCTYHGWTYGLDGKLTGVPGFRELYQEKINRDEWGLIPAGKVQSYRGFVFATMDPEAPDLEEYLGDVGRTGLNFIASQGDMVVVEGVQKNRLECNWKIVVDNTFDWYHAQISHASAFMSGAFPRSLPDDTANELLHPFGSKQQRVLFGDYGHAISGPRLTDAVWDGLQRIAARDESIVPSPVMNSLLWRLDPRAGEELGEIGTRSLGHPHIFPNLFVSTITNQVALRLPKGPNETELWWFTFVNKDWPDEVKAGAISLATRVFGPAGMLEQDDGENWEMSTSGTRGLIAREYPLNYQMDAETTNLTVPEVGAPYIDTLVNEHAQLWTYRAWADWMSAESWEELKQNHATPQDVFKSA
ncbi:nitrite reductase/ring-hydroxylating ferredoxin subunit [Sphingomonas sp. PvP055]|uniref:aromatic ring-hydroxylating oxygenase subunit alpha n=1 Tax=Sphingomonas sp. PvP055 TaxID=3156391 RepID=UPI003398C118